MHEKILKKSLLQKVERLEAFEERMMIRLENISIEVFKWGGFSLFCEVYPVNGTKINEDISIECVIYDKEGAILKVEENVIRNYKFFGFEVVEYIFNDDNLKDKNNISKIRIYPKKT